MKVMTTIDEMRQQVAQWRIEGHSIGFVPTMGYLHEGHASLVDASVAQCDRTVVSVFVNPTQFGPNEDLESYPRDFEHDCALLEQHGCDMVFHPSAEEMYPAGFATYVELHSDMPKKLCGKTRPIHFRGVCTVVCKLFHIVSPDFAFFGQKDAQQLAILKQMVRDLAMPLQLVGCPIVREEDGLAKSSRNSYLSGEERKAATALYQTLAIAKSKIEAGERSTTVIEDTMRACIERSPRAKLDYAVAVRADDLSTVPQLSGEILLALAVYIGKTRLIDNFVVEVKK